MEMMFFHTRNTSIVSISLLLSLPITRVEGHNLLVVHSTVHLARRRRRCRHFPSRGCRDTPDGTALPKLFWTLPFFKVSLRSVVVRVVTVPDHAPLDILLREKVSLWDKKVSAPFGWRPFLARSRICRSVHVHQTPRRHVSETLCEGCGNP